MAVQQIDFRDTGAFSKMILDYLEGKETLKPFYKYPMELPAFGQVIRDKSVALTNREVLVDVLLRQHVQLPANEKVTANIRSLLQANTYTVTTGHQLNIFTGPLYFIYKIITAVNLAHALTEMYPETPVVPVYWMATEDHDFAEINHIHLFNKRISWEGDYKGAVGHIDPKAAHTAIEEAKSILGDSEAAQKLAALLEQSYLQHDTLADATRYLVHQLFGHEGLIIMDADDAELKATFAGIMEQDITSQQSYQLVEQTNAQLGKSYDIQVNPRPINFFYLREDYRDRLVTDGTTYSTNDGSYQFTEAELRKEIESHPERFSPNVVMRPLYEEYILPNLAYIGGPGELAYWMQLRTLFEAYHVNFPVLVLRNCALMIDEPSAARIEKLGISIPELFMHTDQLVKMFVTKNANEELSLGEETASIEHTFEQIMTKGLTIDPTLKGSVESEKAKILNAIHALEQKLLKAEKKKFETEIGQLQKLKEKLFPGGGLQERYENFMSYYLKKGDTYVPDLTTELRPFVLNKSFTVIS
jgi:bacillithiol biosynthesis cysteine-adding enzyme BshC